MSDGQLIDEIVCRYDTGGTRLRAAGIEAGFPDDAQRAAGVGGVACSG
jgi:hypothetical protein